MATSGVSVYSTNILTIYEDALRKIKVLGQGESSSSAMKTDDLSLVETYFKGLSGFDLTLYKTETASISLVEDDADYVLGAGQTITALPVQLTDVVFRDDTTATAPIDTKLYQLTREEYMRLPNKLVNGQPAQYYYEKLTTTGTIYLYPVPDADQAGLKLYIKYITYLDNVTSISTNEIDMPVEWMETVTYGLASRLARPYGLSLEDRQDLRNEYNKMVKDMLDHDQEDGSIYLRPSPRMGQ